MFHKIYIRLILARCWHVIFNFFHSFFTNCHIFQIVTELIKFISAGSVVRILRFFFTANFLSEIDSDRVMFCLVIVNIIRTRT